MGYDVHTTRARDSVDGRRLPIGYGEWLALVRKDPGMEMAGTVEVTTGIGETLRYENEGLAVWKEHPSSEEIPFDLRGGNVTVFVAVSRQASAISEVTKSVAAARCPRHGRVAPSPNTRRRHVTRRREHRGGNS